jgi:hypothetical protein
MTRKRTNAVVQGIYGTEIVFGDFVVAVRLVIQGSHKFIDIPYGIIRAWRRRVALSTVFRLSDFAAE